MLESHQVLASALETFPHLPVLSPQQELSLLGFYIETLHVEMPDWACGRGAGWVILLLKVFLFPPRSHCMPVCDPAACYFLLMTPLGLEA